MLVHVDPRRHISANIKDGQSECLFLAMEKEVWAGYEILSRRHIIVQIEIRSFVS